MDQEKFITIQQCRVQSHEISNNFSKRLFKIEETVEGIKDTVYNKNEGSLKTFATKHLVFWLVGGISTAFLVALNFFNSNLQAQIQRNEVNAETIRVEIRDDLKEIRKEVTDINYKLNGIK